MIRDTQLSSRRDHKQSTYRLSVIIGSQGRCARGFIDRKDGKGGKTTRRKPDNRQFEEYSQKAAKMKTGGQVQEGKNGGTRKVRR